MARAKRILLAVAASAIVFIIIGWPLGVVAMVDFDYCFTHPDRPATTSFHDERLSWFPPGPECRFTVTGTGGVETVVAGVQRERNW